MASIKFYPVGNGDTSQIILDNGRRILMDFRHQKNGEDDKSPVIDLAATLRQELKDADKDHFDVVAFTHADLDHIQNCHEFFELPGAGEKYTGGDRIKIQEIWVPCTMLFEMVKQNQRGDEFEVLRRELRHRFRNGKGIKVFSRSKAMRDWMEEEELSYEDKKHLFVYAGQTVNTFKYEHDQVEFFTHSPFSDSDSTADDVYRNEDALVFQVRFKAPVPVNLMAFGDSKWDAIDTIVQRSKDKNNTDRLKWDLLNIPHHCSYECLHADKEDEARKDERITVPTMLIKELLEEHSSWYAHLVSSSWPIRDDEEAYAQMQPPHIQAQKGYKDSIGSDVRFWVTMAYPNEDKPEPLEFEVGTFGLTKKKATRRSAAISTAAYAGATANPRSGTLDE